MIKKKFTKRRRVKKNRGYFNPQYKKVRIKVFTRDKWTCQFPGCNNTGSLESHHIKKWSKYPLLRLSEYNIITLCGKCHRKITGYEEQYEPMLHGIIRKKYKNKRNVKSTNVDRLASREKKENHMTRGHNGVRKKQRKNKLS